MLLGPLAGSALAAVDGSDVVPIGAAPDAGSLLDLGIRPVEAVLGIAASATGNGYWMVAGDGGIFAFGDAPFFGSMGGTRLNRPMVGMAASSTGNGYWMFAADGGIFAFGDARFFGSTADLPLQGGIVAMAPTATNQGYWLVGSDGGVFAFGDATFLGSVYDQLPAGTRPRGAIVGLASMRTGTGYWLVTSAGEVFAFGDARTYGDLSRANLSNPVVGLAPSPTGRGYWLAQADGQVWAFGDASTQLATGPRCQEQSVVGLAARPQGDGLWLVTAPRPFPSLTGLHPLDQLEREHEDLVGDLRFGQACQTARDPGTLRLTNPAPGSAITSVYGPRTHPVYRRPQFHRGIDLAGGERSVRAAAAGTVLQVSTRVGYGTTVVIDHGGRLATVYAHFASAAVRPGQQVQAGEVIGQMGATGFATGVHLHFEVRVNGQPVDPAPLLPSVARRSGGATS